MTPVILTPMADALHLLGWSLLHFVWQAAILALALGAILAAARKAAAQVRYAACCGTMALMALCPVATFAYLAITAGDAAREDIVAVASRRGPLPPNAGWKLTTATLAERISAEADQRMPWILAAWMLGVALLLSRAIGAGVAVRRLKSEAIAPVSEGLAGLAREVAARLGISQAFGFFASHAVSAPMVIGWLKPVVLFPAASLMELSPEQFEAILLHELAHIRRRDYLVNATQVAMETLLFYHPAVWWVSRKIRQEREHCCDDLVVAATGSPLVYVKALYLLEEQRSTGPELAVGGNGGQLKMRIKRLLTGEPKEISYRATGWVLTATVLLLVGGLTASTATLGRAWAQNAAPAQSASQLTPRSMPPHAAPHEIPWSEAAEHLRDRKPPEYPEMAKAANVSGEVRIALVIGGTGDVEAAHVVSGPQMLQQAALDSVIHYKFSPFAEGDVSTTVKILFTLGDVEGKPDLSCTYYDNGNTAHAGTCESHEGADPKFYCRQNEGDQPSQVQVGCQEKLAAFAEWKAKQAAEKK